MNGKNDLRGCPFCGEAELLDLPELDFGGGYDPTGDVACLGCGADGPKRDRAGQRADAVERWNTRSSGWEDIARTALIEIAALGDGRRLNWGDAQDAADIAKEALAKSLPSTGEPQ